MLSLLKGFQMSSGSFNSLKKISKDVPGYVEALRILNELQLDDYHASDRMAAIVGAAFVEDALKFSINEKLSRKPDRDDDRRIYGFEENGPLSSLGSRILIAYHLDVFGPITREDLKLLTSIRNVFAHTASAVGFDHPDVDAACKNFKLIETFGSKVELLTAKMTYIETCAQITGRLSLRVKGSPGSGLKFEVNSLP